MGEQILRLTKSGKPIWIDNSTRGNEIMTELKNQGYTTDLTVDQIMKNKYYIVR